LCEEKEIAAAHWPMEGQLPPLPPTP
jgi:hypothetical protein